MNTLPLVDGEQRDQVGTFPAFDPDKQSIPEYRRMVVEGLTALWTPEPMHPETLSAPGRDGAPPVRVLVYRPEKSTGPSPAIVYAHGGGMIAGTPDMMAGAHQALADDTGVVVLSVDYRLAPEAPFPGALDDVYAVLTWAHDQAASLDIDPIRVSLMGDSGGGCLAAATSLLARDLGGPPVRAQFLVYAMLDSRVGTEASPYPDDPTTGEFFWTREQNAHAWRTVRSGQKFDAERLGYFSPAQAQSLDGLPAAVVVVGGLDLFRDEDVEYARRLAAAGVATELHVYPGGIHGFDLLGGELAARFKHDMREAIRRLA